MHYGSLHQKYNSACTKLLTLYSYPLQSQFHHVIMVKIALFSFQYLIWCGMLKEVTLHVMTIFSSTFILIKNCGSFQITQCSLQLVSTIRLSTKYCWQFLLFSLFCAACFFLSLEKKSAACKVHPFDVLYHKLTNLKVPGPIS